MSNRFDVLERYAPLFPSPEPSFDQFLRRRDRKRRNKRVAAGVVGILFFVAPIAFFAGRISAERTHQTQIPATRPTTAPLGTAPGFVLDLRTGKRTPLAESLAGGLRFAASPDGTTLAYMGYEGEVRQIFTARIDGTGIRQMTHDPIGATSPAWSPDGTKIAYVGGGTGYFADDRDLFVLDVATGESTKVIDGGASGGLQFTPDGSSLLYDGGGGGFGGTVLRTVPVAGGKSSLLIPPSEGVTDAGDGSLSPDGSLVTYLGGGSFRSPSGAFAHCGPCRWVANADGTDRRVLPKQRCWVSNPAGTWSPDSSRIVCSGDNGDIVVADILTGRASRVAEGNGAVWLDNDTLLVEVVHPVNPGPG